MTVKELISEIEHLYGRQPHMYMKRLINDALLDINDNKQHYTVAAKRDLVGYDRWYTLTDDMVDIKKIEILDTNSRYVRIPKLTDPHKLLKDDTDESVDSLT